MRIAITGGVAEGKSTVLGYLAQKGLSVASADHIASSLLEEERYSHAVANQFNLPMPLDRHRIAAIIFEDSSARKWLNNLLHRPVLEKMRQTNADAFEVPLLIESCLQAEFDEIWVVTCGAVEQRRRLRNRVINSDFADQVLRSQLATRAKLPFADRIIRTNVDEASVRIHVLSIIAEHWGR